MRVNQKIKAREIRLINETGEQLGIIPLYQALELAKEQQLDLVEVARNTVPPVCRLLDYGKFKYELAKKERGKRQSQKAVALREVKLRPKISEHDLQAKAKIVKKLIEEGDKVKVLVIFRGRENTHPEIGFKVLQKMAEILTGVASWEHPPTLVGTTMQTIFTLISTKKTTPLTAAKES